MEDKNRLEAVIDVLKEDGKVKNVSDFGRQIGYSPATLANILNGNKKLSSALINTINEKFPIINLYYLQQGTLPIKIQSGIPYIREDQFGSFTLKYSDQNFMDSVQRETISVISNITPDDWLFDIPYNHPDRIFLKNDLALARKVNKPEKLGIYYVLSTKGQFTLGTCKFKDEKLVIKSFSPTGLQADIELENIRDLWKVWGIITTALDVDLRFMGMITPFKAWKMIREQSKEIKALRAKIRSLESQLNSNHSDSKAM